MEIRGTVIELARGEGAADASRGKETRGGADAEDSADVDGGADAGACAAESCRAAGKRRDGAAAAGPETGAANDDSFGR